MTSETRDGRLERSSATRRAILQAARELLVESASKPTAREIAERADVTTRTLFRHFSEMESLYRTLVEEAQAEVALIMDTPAAAICTEERWHARRDHLIERRVRVYEYVLPLYVAGVWPGDGSQLDSAQQLAIVKHRRARLRASLPEHIVKDSVLFEAIDATLTIGYWASLRRDQGLSRNRAREVLSRALQQLTEVSSST